MIFFWSRYLWTTGRLPLSPPWPPTPSRLPPTCCIRAPAPGAPVLVPAPDPTTAAENAVGRTGEAVAPPSSAPLRRRLAAMAVAAPSHNSRINHKSISSSRRHGWPSTTPGRAPSRCDRATLPLWHRFPDPSSSRSNSKSSSPSNSLLSVPTTLYNSVHRAPTIPWSASRPRTSSRWPPTSARRH